MPLVVLSHLERPSLHLRTRPPANSSKHASKIPAFLIPARREQSRSVECSMGPASLYAESAEAIFFRVAESALTTSTQTTEIEERTVTLSCNKAVGLF